MDARARTAFVDESFRRADDGRGLFLLAAVIVPDQHHADVRDELRRHVAPGQHRWHFRDERKDRREIMGAQRAGVASPSLTYCHARPKDEPLLWLPDALAGAIGMSIADNDHQLIMKLPEPLRQISRVGP